MHKSEGVTVEVFEREKKKHKKKESKREQKEKMKLTLQTAEAFRSLIISTNKLPHHCDPLWVEAKVRNAPPSSKYH